MRFRSTPTSSRGWAQAGSKPAGPVRPARRSPIAFAGRPVATMTGGGWSSYAPAFAGHGRASGSKQARREPDLITLLSLGGGSAERLLGDSRSRLGTTDQRPKLHSRRGPSTTPCRPALPRLRGPALLARRISTRRRADHDQPNRTPITVPSRCAETRCLCIARLTFGDRCSGCSIGLCASDCCGYDRSIQAPTGCGERLRLQSSSVRRKWRSEASRS
jgi:hypothetical protein